MSQKDSQMTKAEIAMKKIDEAQEILQDIINAKSKSEKKKLIKRVRQLELEAEEILKK